jgi:hypothetical protein
MTKQVYYDQENVDSNLETVFGLEPTKNNQKNKPNGGRGGRRPGAGRKLGSIQKLGGADLLIAIAKETGQSFADNIAKHYHRAIIANEWNDVRDYEKFIIAKVISDVKEIDVTTQGKALTAVFTFPTRELDDWK